jgi:hypothetical protein
LTILNSLYIVFITGISFVLLWKWKFLQEPTLPYSQVCFFFGLKLLASFILFLIYTRIYTERTTADIFKYVDDATLLHDSLFHTDPLQYLKLIIGIHEHTALVDSALHKTHFWFKPYETTLYNDNRTIIRINAFIRLISFGYYPIHALIFSFLSFIGLISIYKTFTPLFQDKRLLLKICCFAFPSILIWSSGVLKESLLVLGIGILLYQASKISELKTRKRRNFIGFIFAFGILLITKPYILLLFIPGLISYFLSKKEVLGSTIATFIAVHSGVLVLLLFLRAWIPSMDFVHIIYKMQHDFLNVARDTHARSWFHTFELNDSLASLISNTPEALFNVLLKPLFIENYSFLSILNTMECAVIILLFILASGFRKKQSNEVKPLWLLAFSFSFSVFILIGLTVPVQGAIVRYKIPGLLFLLLFLLSILNVQKLKCLLKRKNN